MVRNSEDRPLETSTSHSVRSSQPAYMVELENKRMLLVTWFLKYWTLIQCIIQRNYLLIRVVIRRIRKYETVIWPHEMNQLSRIPWKDTCAACFTRPWSHGQLCCVLKVSLAHPSYVDFINKLNAAAVVHSKGWKLMLS